MSSYMAIAAASEGLRQVLWDSFSIDKRISRHIHSREEISLSNPTDAARDSANKLSVWLYNLVPNEFMRNAPAPRPGDPNRAPPLALDLSYLITPISPGSELDLMLVGKVIEVFHAAPVVILRSEADDIHEELRITQARAATDEMCRIWDALKQPYRLSVGFVVRVARIDSGMEVAGAAPVVDRFPGVGFAAEGQR